MAEIVWNRIGERLFEAGVDRGVLYTGPQLTGVPWNGLISVNENVSGGEKKPYYFDGVKTFDRVTSEEFQATVEAYVYPDEFAECDGTARVGQGVYATRQNRQPFGLCYRTLVGNDVDETDFAYKIHLIYNATASPTTKSHKTLSDVADPENFQWTIDAVAPPAIGYKPTAHFVVDSRKVYPYALFAIEEYLYGSDTKTPKMPPQALLIEMMNSQFGDTLDGGNPFATTPGLADGNDPSTSVDGGTPV